ncbi:MAG: DUF4397 domain-containing protein [Peptostreptococcaceae bacterium]
MDCFEIKKENSLLRVFHSAPNALPFDVYVDDILMFSNLAYSEFTEYVYVEMGNHRVDIYAAGTKEEPLISRMVNIPEEEMITSAIIGKPEDLDLLVINDHIETLPSDEYSTFRIVHLVPGGPSVDILIDGELFFKDINYKEGTQYVDANPGEYKIKIIQNSDDKVLLPLRIKLKPDRIYTIYIIENKGEIGVIQSVDGNTYICK